MKTNQLLEILKDFGLSANESKVYFTSLSLGPTTILRLSQTAEIKRTTAYVVVESLIAKGLMNIELAGFKKKYSAEDPQKLEGIFDARKRKFQELLPEFSALYNLRGGESFIKYYEGIEAIKGIYETLIRDIQPHEEYMVLSHQDQWLSHDKDYFMDFTYRRAKLPINIRLALQDTEVARDMKRIERNIHAEVRLLPEGRKLSTNLVITPQRVLIHQLSHPVLAIVIENKSVIQMHTEMYEVIWSSIE